MPVIEFQGEGESFPLKTAPPDGFVKARPLSYAETLTRRDLATKLIYRQKEELEKNGKKRADVTTEDLEMMMESSSSVVQKFQFKTQILDHNLEFPGGVRINFNNDAHLKKLPTHIGAEIEEILDKLNEGEEEGDFPEQSTTSSSVEETSLVPTEASPD